MFQQLLANKHHEVASFEVWLREVWVWSPTKRRKKKKKPRVKHEPRSAHGRAVKKKIKQRVKHEPRSAHGRAVNKHQNIYLHVSCLQAVLVDLLLTVDTKSPDQYVMQQLTATIRTVL